MTTLTEKELMSLNGEEKQDASFATVTADNFVGHLTGVADNAKRLYESQRLVLQGDVSGATDIGQGNTSIDVTVNHAKNADVATSCGYATDSLNASHADLANIATFAHTADKAVDAEHANESDEALHSVESDHALQSDKSLQADSASNAKEAEHSLNSDESLHAIQADTDNKERNIADTFDAILYTDLPTIRTDIVNITPTEHTVEFKDKEYKLKNTLLADDDNENKLLQDFSNGIQDIDNRVTNLETTTDLGKVTERIVKIEELNNQQNARLDSIDTLNTEQDTRLDNVESLANNTATTVTENKNAVDTQINNLKQELDASLEKLSADLATTNTNVQTNANNIATNTQGIADIKNGYLSLAGGQMTGTTIASSINDSMLVLAGGTDADNGASFTVNGKDNSNGSFIARANNGNTSADLIGASNGTLQWDDKNLVRSVNSINADINGNVQLGNIEAITGEVKWFAFNTAPDGFLVCNGATVSRETYADLFAVIGTTYGAGDGSTTFVLPNLIDKFAQGSTKVGTYKSAGLPNITGDIVVKGNVDRRNFLTGMVTFKEALPFKSGAESALSATSNSFVGHEVNTLNAHNSNTIYGNSSTVQPPALTLLPCIKY